MSHPCGRRKGNNTAALTILKYLRDNGGRAVINGMVLARETGFTQSAISYSLRVLQKNEFVATTSKTGTGFRNPEFFLTEKGKSCTVPEFHRKASSAKGVPKTPTVKSNEDIASRVDSLRELTEVYLKLDEAQKLVLQLQSEKDQLQAKVKELEDELQLENIARSRDANDIKTLELQLRELRVATDRNARQVVFNHRGVQS